MKTPLNTELEDQAKKVRSLEKALVHGERVKEVVKESAEELNLVNSKLKDEVLKQNLPYGIEQALKKNEVVERKIQDAHNQMEVVNLVIKGEIRERNLDVLQLAAVMEQEESARQAALHDSLTGLPNRTLFNDRLEHGFAQAQRHEWMMAVMFIDLDKFKEINDTYGHDVGDTVLKITAQRLKETTRDDDTICRHGGDEFLYLLTEVGDKANIAMIAEKIINTLKMPFDGNISNHSIDASIGIAIFPKDGTTVESLTKSADAAMYKAKQNKTGYAFAS